MSADRNLLYGMLALQMEYLSREQLLDAFAVWMTRKETPLGELLRERGVLSDDDHVDLERLVQRQLRKHGDVSRSLASLNLATPDLLSLQQLEDADVQAAVGTVLTSAPNGVSTKDEGTFPATNQRYRVVTFHARGGLGEVHLAIDQELQREIALKRLRSEYADDSESRRRFIREAEITGGLAHPNIVAIHGLVRDEHGRPEYSMPFLRGETMQEAIQRFHRHEHSKRDPGERSLAQRELLTRFVATCQAMNYAHVRGVVHRDLKPSNVMLGEFGETIVLDWGLAKLIQADEGETMPYRPPTVTTEEDSATRQGQVMGTPAYLPPEQARGELEKIGPTTDVWALGAVLYAIVTGKPPYVGENLLKQAEKGEVRPAREVNPSVPPALSAICQKAMASEPQSRYETARALADDVERWLADEPVSAYAEPLRVKLRRWTKRHRTLVTSVFVLLVAGVVSLTVGLWAVNAEKNRTNLALDEARENLKLAKEAIDECFNVCKEDPLFQVPRMEKVKKLLLRKTLPFYKRFRQARGDDEISRREEAKQLHWVGHIAYVLGDHQEAIDAYEQAKKLRLLLSQTHPDVPEYQQDLARTHYSLGTLLNVQGKREEAQKEYEHAKKIQLLLSQTHPDVPEYQQDLARTHYSLGTLLNVQGKREEAQKEYEHAKKIQLLLSQTHPDVPGYQQHLSGTLVNVSILQREMGKVEESLKTVEQVIPILSKLHQQEPQHPTYRLFLRNAHWSRAETLSQLNRHREAVADWEEVIRLEANPAYGPYWRTQRAYFLAHAGEHQLAAKEVDNLAPITKIPEFALYKLACVQALNAASRPLPVREKDADGYAQKAVTLLQRAARAGYFKDKATVEHLKKDSDLDSLRSRPDFQAFVASLAATKSKP